MEASEKQTDKPKKREPTTYVALIAGAGDQEGLLSPVAEAGTLRVFEAFRREEVLQELIEEGAIAVPDDAPEDKRNTPWVYIVPASRFIRLRGYIPPPSRVQLRVERDV